MRVEDINIEFGDEGHREGDGRGSVLLTVTRDSLGTIVFTLSECSETEIEVWNDADLLWNGNTEGEND